jgi:hypothetical protein
MPAQLLATWTTFKKGSERQNKYSIRNWNYPPSSLNVHSKKKNVILITSSQNVTAQELILPKIW